MARPQTNAAGALTLLTDAAKTNSIEKELKAIDRETSRYEFSRHLRGFTIHQGGTQWRETKQVAWVGREQIAGRDVIVLDYRQTPSTSNEGGFRLPREFGKASGRFQRGRLWLDAETFQVWRDIWEVAVIHSATQAALAMAHVDRTFAASRFGILVPDRIEFRWLTHFSHPKNGVAQFSLSERTTFTYASFRRFEVVTDEDVTLPEARDR